MSTIFHVNPSFHFLPRPIYHFYPQHQSKKESLQQASPDRGLHLPTLVVRYASSNKNRTAELKNPIFRESESIDSVTAFMMDRAFLSVQKVVVVENNFLHTPVPMWVIGFIFIFSQLQT